MAAPYGSLTEGRELRSRGARRPLALAASLVVVVSLAWPGVAAAQEPASGPTDAQVVAAIDATERLLATNRGAEALSIIRPVAEARPDSTQAAFSMGLSALAAGDQAAQAGANPRKEPTREYFDIAVRTFRGMLVKDPSLLRVRLELGRALFSRGVCLQPPPNLMKHILGDDCWAAEQHFIRTIGRGVPPSVALNIRRFIRVIRARKQAQGSLNLALAPDTNINNSTSADTVNILGLPFQLDDNARAQSGIGLVGTLNGQYQRPIPKWKYFPGVAARLRVGGNIFRREYSGGQFDDYNYGVHAGPRFIGNSGDMSVLFQADRRQVNGRPYSQQYGLTLEGQRMIVPKIWVTGAAGIARVTPLNSTGQAGDKGLTWNVITTTSYSMFPWLNLRIIGGMSREKTGRIQTRHQSRWLGVTANWDLPYGFTVTGAQQLFLTRYDEPVYIFGNDSPDTRMWFSRVALFNRQIRFMGFSPSISFIREDRSANLTVFQYKRYRVESGVVRVF